MQTVTYQLDTFSGLYQMVVNTENYSSGEKEHNVCRFCGETNPVRFNTVAHVLPKFTGNKELVHFCECDTCNNKFSKYERDLSIFGGIKNTIAGIKGKKYPMHIDKENHFKAIRSRDSLSFYKHEDTDAITVKDNKLMVASETQKFRPRFVQKALVKAALSLMDAEELPKFKKTIDWLSIPEDNFTEHEHPIFLLIERENKIPLRKPGAILMRRIKPYNSPEYSLLFFYSFFSYQIFLPFNEVDVTLDYDNLFLPLSALVITDLKNLKEVGFNHYYMTTLKKVKLTDHFECDLI